MQVGCVIGHATATVKHASLTGWRLLVVQMQTADAKDDGEPVLAIDLMGAGSGDLVVVSNDGAAARAAVGSKTSPVRWLVLGVCDP